MVAASPGISPSSSSKISSRALGFALFLLLLVAIFWSQLASLVGLTLHDDSSTHILFIPAIAMFLIYLSRKRVFHDTKSSCATGTILLLAGTGVCCLGIMRTQTWRESNFLFEIILSFVLLVIGGFIFWFGMAAFRKAAFPLSFLLLMVPLPGLILDKVVHLLQAGSTAIAYDLFRLFSVPVLRDQFVLVLPGFAVEVAKECSSIRSSLALFIAALLAAHLYLRRPWSKFVLVALAIPLAVFKNGVRIFTLCMLAIHVDPGFLTGKLHREGGVVFYCFALLILGAVLCILRLTEKPRSVDDLSPRRDGLTGWVPTSSKCQ